MEVWVQRSLFDEPAFARPTTITLSRQASAAERRRPLRVDRSRVTRDPAVALSHANGAAAASDFRLGLARAFHQLPPEQRDALRALFRRDRSTSAA